MNEKGFINIVFVALAILLVGAAGYFVFKNNPEMPNSQSTRNTHTNIGSYSNAKYGIVFKYPAEYCINEGATYGNKYTLLFYKKPCPVPKYDNGLLVPGGTVTLEVKITFNNKQTLDEWLALKKSEDPSFHFSATKIEINSIPAYKIRTTFKNGNHNDNVTLKNNVSNYFYQFITTTISPDGEKILNSTILQTFKFTN